MANYVGAKCPVCDATFTEDDDIVVCPICGTPHHRACYHKRGKCAFDEMHAQGHSWTLPQDAQQEQTTQNDISFKNCPSCGTINPKDSIFCQKCGARFGNEQTTAFNAASFAYTTAFGGVSPTEEIAGVTARDLALYVGTGSHYFLPRFRAIGQGHNISLNIPAFFNFLYFFYRKMYGIGLALLGLYVIVQIPSIFYAYELVGFVVEHLNEILPNMDMTILSSFVPTHYAWTISMMNVAQYILFATSLFLTLFANRIYLFSAIRNIRKIHTLCEKSTDGFDDGVYTEMLARRGRTSFGLVATVIIGIIIASFLVSMLMTFPYIDAL